jgi:hypothetical protein
MRSVALPATRLLEHYRQAHGGDVPDDVLAWADGVRCSDCGMPYRRTGLAAHRRRDPADGALRCPALIRPEAASVLVTEADVRFVDSLTADQVYIGVASSLDSIDAAVRDEYSAAVASLVAPCYEAADAELQRVRWRVLHVALLALHRPMGAQANRVRVMRDRLRRLRAGGALEASRCVPALPLRAVEAPAAEPSGRR